MNKELLNLNDNVSKLFHNAVEIERLQQNLKEKVDLLKNRLQISHRETENVISLIPDGILLINHAERIFVCNAAARAILDLPTGIETKDYHFSHFFKDDLFGFSVSQMLKNPEKPKTFCLTFSNHYETKDVEVFVRSYENGLFILIRDRSSYKQLEQSLEKYKSIAELGQMVATLAHEIRNPLTGIEGFAGILEEELLNPRHKKMIRSVIEGTRSLNYLVSSMLQYTHIPSLTLYPTNICDFITKLLPLFEAPFSSGRLFFNIENPTVVRSIDKDRFQSVLWNLIKNAFEASLPNKTIVITLTNDGDIIITNEGDPIPQDKINQLFVPFFTTKPDGNGLGLAESLKVIRMHGGNIVVKSMTEQTSFIIKLPG
ncbi:MAG: histidine kinase dimerization/phospho-acceptor domain-containing protein [Victivallaceae bacterium]